VPQSSSPAGAGVLRVDVEIAQPAPRKRIDAATLKKAVHYM
jgi:hypothetical protein